MFQHRSSDFDPRVSAIVNHLRGIQDQLGKIGRDAGRRGADSAAEAGNQIVEAITPILNDIAARFRRGQRAAVEGASGLGDQAVQLSSRVGSQAVARLTDQTQQRPLVMLAVAIGIGILIGAASRRVAVRRPSQAQP
jgi:ElaB/YqjD/DUF883 family membrane-anchored ribosome-binding protein